MKTYIILALTALLYGCSSGIKNEGCQNNLVKMIGTVNYAALENILLDNSDTSQMAFITEIVGSIKSFGDLTSEIVEAGGGLDPVTLDFVGGCQMSSNANLLFSNSRLAQINSEIALLKSQYRDKDQLELLDMYSNILDLELYQNPFFEDLSTKTYYDISMRLLVLQNRLYILAIKYYMLKNKN